MTSLDKTLANLPTENVTFVTQPQLETILQQTVLASDKNSMFASVIQLTEPRLTVKCRDTKEPYNKVIKKLSKVSIILNRDYVAQVEKQLDNEGKEKTDYKKGRNSMPIDKSESANNFFGYYYNKAVIEYRPNDNSAPTTQYFEDGASVEKSELPNVLPVVKKASNQGTEREIFWRKLYVKNIVQISLNGKVYRILK